MPSFSVLSALVADTCGPFVAAYIRAVTLHNFPLEMIMPAMLRSSLFLGEHTHVIHMCPSPNFEQVAYNRMAFIHPTRFPAGQAIPIQCEKCFCLFSFKNPKPAPKDPFNELLSCKICQGVTHLTFSSDYQVVPNTMDAEGAAWYSLTEIFDME